MPITRRSALATTLLAATAFGTGAGAAPAVTEIDLFFPVPVQGRLAAEMQRLTGEFNASHPDSTSPPSTPAPTTTRTSRPAAPSRPGARRRW